jgi:hypothetical protein
MSTSPARVVMLLALLAAPALAACSSTSSAVDDGGATADAATCKAGTERVCNGDPGPTAQCQCLVRCDAVTPTCGATECCASIQDVTGTWCRSRSLDGTGGRCGAELDAGRDAPGD